MLFVRGGFVARQIVNTKVSGDISERAATYLTNIYDESMPGCSMSFRYFRLCTKTTSRR